jgi:hypothetical protein
MDPPHYQDVFELPDIATADLCVANKDATVRVVVDIFVAEHIGGESVEPYKIKPSRIRYPCIRPAYY